MIDSKMIEDYLLLRRDYGESSLIPVGATNVKVTCFEKMSGHVTNDLFSFSLAFSKDGVERSLDLLLKTYLKPVALWFETYRPNEEVRKYVREFQALKSLENAGFPVPRVFVCECDSYFIGYPFVIMQKVEAQEIFKNLDVFASTLAHLHNLDANKLRINCLKFPDNDSAFAAEWTNILKHVLAETKHYRDLRKDFEYTINWLESNWRNNKCPQYRVIHGEYHPGHVIITKDNELKVIDWEGVAIGDPAYDVGYAYHMVRLMYNQKSADSGESAAKQFISEYAKCSKNDVEPRLDFYKVVGILGVTIAVSSVISHPLEVYKRFGGKASVRAFAFPIFRLTSIGRKWLNQDFIISYLQYCKDFIRSTLK